jgi:hypothetical protein
MLYAYYNYSLFQCDVIRAIDKLLPLPIAEEVTPHVGTLWHYEDAGFPIIPRAPPTAQLLQTILLAAQTEEHEHADEQ